MWRVEVFLIRHAAAVDETLDLRDPLRHLTLEGREQARCLGDRLRWRDCHPTHIWTSPLVRAVQTAELVAAGLQLPITVDVLPQLAPGEPLRPVQKALAQLPRDAHAILVGHEPSISGIGELLLGGNLAALNKAEAVRISDGKLRWRFAWNAEAPDR
jgi:phosphohistidine phosphatase